MVARGVTVSEVMFAKSQIPSRIFDSRFTSLVLQNYLRRIALIWVYFATNVLAIV